jgi:hypothetical protein
MSWGWDPSLNTKFIYVSHIPYTYIQPGSNIYTMFLVYLHFDCGLSSCELRYGTSHLGESCQNSVIDFGLFQLWDF